MEDEPCMPCLAGLVECCCMWMRHVHVSMRGMLNGPSFRRLVPALLAAFSGVADPACLHAGRRIAQLVTLR